MTKDELRARLEALDQQRQDLIAQINAVMGAMQEVERWIDQWAEPVHPDMPLDPE